MADPGPWRRAGSTVAQVDAEGAGGAHHGAQVGPPGEQVGDQVGAHLQLGLGALALTEQDERGHHRGPLDGAPVGLVEVGRPPTRRWPSGRSTAETGTPSGRRAEHRPAVSSGVSTA